MKTTVESLRWRGHTVLSQIESFDCEHDKRVKFFMAVDNSNQISRVSLCKDLNLDQALLQRRQDGRTTRMYFKTGCNRSCSCS